MSPFAGYVNFADCVSKNKDKSNPEAYCGKIKHQVEDALPSCVFARMECLEKKYPNMFTQKQRLDMSYDFCFNNSNAQDFGNGSLFSYVEDTIGSKTLKGLREYRTLKDVWEIVRTLGVPILYDKEKKVEYEGKLVLKKLNKKDFLVEDVKPYYGSKIGSGETPAEKAQKKSQEAYKEYKQQLEKSVEAPGTQLRNLPETPVSSSNVMTEAVVNNRLYLRFHSSPEFSYKYSFGSNEEALTAADELTKGSPGRYVWKKLRGKELGPVFGKPQKLTPGGTTASKVPYDKSRYTRIKQYMGRMPEIEAKYGSLEEIAENMRQFKVGVKEEKAPEEETEPGELEAGGTSGAPFRPKELEKYQEGIYKEKKKRKKYKEEAKAMIAELRKKHQGDYIVEDSMDELFEWVQSKIESDSDEAKRIAFAIVNYRKKKGKKEKGNKDEWKEDWKTISNSFKKGREQYRQMKKGEELQFKRSVYGSFDFDEYDIIDFIEEDLTEEELNARFKASQKKFQEKKEECKWITIKGTHVCITPKKTKFGVKKQLYEEIWNKTKKTGKEKGYLIDENGKEVKFKGTENSIDPWEVRKASKEMSGDLTFIHSHPSNSIFSSGDIAVFILSSKVRKMGVVTKDGNIYELEKSKDIERYSNNDIDKAKQRYKDEVIRARNIENREKAENQILNNFAKKYNLKYSREKTSKTDLVNQIDYLQEQLASHGFYLEEHLDEFYDFIEGYNKDFDPNQKGHWITSKGKHIFIPEGHSLSFGKNGEYSTSKSKKEEILSKVQKIKKEKRIRKLMEEGNAREIAERKAEDEEIEQEQKRKKEERKKKEPSKKEPTISKGIQAKISRKQEAINKRLDKLRSVSKGKSSGQIIGELITLTLRMLQQASKKGGSPIVPFAQYISKIRKDDRIEKEQKIKLISEIDKLKKEISSLRADFILLNEVIELENELEQYDFHLEDHLDDFYKFQKNNEVNIIYE